MPQLPLAGRQSAANLAQRLGPPSWQNSMATNCPQLLNPRACRSARCFRTAVSKPVREMSCKVCEKMLHTRFKAESSSDSLVFANSTYQRLSAFFLPSGTQHGSANLDETDLQSGMSLSALCPGRVAGPLYQDQAGWFQYDRY